MANSTFFGGRASSPWCVRGVLLFLDVKDAPVCLAHGFRYSLVEKQPQRTVSFIKVRPIHRQEGATLSPQLLDRSLRFPSCSRASKATSWSTRGST